MNNFATHFPSLANNPDLQGWMVAVLTLGAMFGAFVNGPIADKISRRWDLLLANIVFLIGSIIQAAAQNVAMIFVGRFIAGLSIGMLSMVVPLYLSELAPPNIRGSLVALQQLGITVGVMVAFWLDYGTQHIGGTGDGQSQIAWKLPLALQCVPSAILALGTMFLPYSPRWLMNQGGFISNSSHGQNLLTKSQAVKKKPVQHLSDSVEFQQMTIASSLSFSKSKPRPYSIKKPRLPGSPTQRRSSSSMWPSTRSCLLFATSTFVFSSRACSKLYNNSPVSI